MAAVARPTFDPAQRAYEPLGSALTLFKCRDEEVLMSGPAGTGKSRGELEKLHLCAEKYAGMRGLILRKTRRSLTEAALVTFEEKVLPARHPALRGPKRTHRSVYRYPNGSEIVVGGLDDSSKVMSTEYDMAYIQEAIEVEEEDWENVTTRLRNGVMPYQPLLGDTNPGSPSHWLKRRCDRGQTTLIECRHEDNPLLWDRRAKGGAGDWTEAGRRYIAKLDALTGVRHKRLRSGLWVMAEGMVYDAWDPARHLIDRADPRYGLANYGDVPPDWPRLWTVDFGYTNPFVWQAWAIDPDGRLLRYREIYKTQTLVEDHAARILDLTAGEPRPLAVICDHDAEDRATLERHLGVITIAAHKAVSDGIQAVASRLRPAADQRPRLLFLRDSLDERDPLLDEAKLPCCTEEEMEGYIWATGGGLSAKEQPVKRGDHGEDTTRYTVAWLDDIAAGAGGGLVVTNYAYAKEREGEVAVPPPRTLRPARPGRR